ncbi:roadblock/LC7 domain-containing protein [Methanobacterium ferruginis]|uniref:roadblock/LC7 domain-containing protein n=1 Tax=Methanobacterium ferruginis TaxID=710191 RepID=UPI002572F137|nr:hypothetical protein [Methanobacterium ferruginis]BDZ69278.1 hypothetical protein GCM10025860_27260 [Methanobacterium ferruginis]
MTDTHLKMQLEKATLNLDKTTDVEGVLIVASDGRILHHNLRVDVDINLFGPMSQVISNSSYRLLNSSGQGEMVRVLVESSGGKALFLGLENAHLIILMQDSANLGLVLVNAKRASEKINEITQDLELEVPELPEETPAEVPEEITEEGLEEAPEEIPEVPEEIPEETPEEIPEVPEEIPQEISEIPVEEVSVEKTGGTTEITPETLETKTKTTETTPETVQTETTPETLETKTKTTEIASETVNEEIESVKVEPKEVKPSIPTVKPPISFPTLPEHVEVPDDPEKRSDLILDIYEKIFLAMSMGAAKIMGVAPARGLTKKFLPFEKCPKLLYNVDLKSNATLDFDQIKKNAANIPVDEREEMFIQDFSRIIEIITENYGRVMGYEAFRGMVRAEFSAIKKSYGQAMDQLNIKKNIHQEVAQLFT